MVMGVSGVLLWCLFLLSTVVDASSLQSQLDSIVSASALYWNTSLSMAFAFNISRTTPPTVFASAAGTNDRFGNNKDPITIASRIPSGSTDKAFTAAAILRSAELGLLELDTPAYRYIDPWLAQQRPPMESLLKQWNGNSVINTVTVRMLLNMRSGIKDYDDGALFKWTLDHPDEDYLPQMFLNNVNKTFEFAPDTGGLYSGTGYVMLGMVLSSVQNASSWELLDQMSPLLSRSASDGGWKLALDNTQFMMQGKCNQYKDVTHQYIYNHQPYSLVVENALPATLVTSTNATNTKTCGGKNYPGESLDGTPAAVFASPSADACCSAISAKGGPGVYWQYDGTNCTAFSSVYKGHRKSGYTSGQTDGPFDPTNVQDLYDYSCLNGYTMGNVAVTPSDVVLFYAALAGGRIVSNKSLAEMRTFQALTKGYSPPPGTPYGLGLLEIELKFSLVSSSTSSAACKKYNKLCSCIFNVCKTHIMTWGHPGLDWASGMPFLGVAEDLNMTFAMGFDSYGGFNSTLTYTENKETYNYYQLQCSGLNAAVKYVYSDFPDFDCGGLSQ
jgi:CubicO group peptidase (beta-lactamase class C family)